MPTLYDVCVITEKLGCRDLKICWYPTTCTENGYLYNTQTYHFVEWKTWPYLTSQVRDTLLDYNNMSEKELSSDKFSSEIILPSNMKVFFVSNYGELYTPFV